MFKNVAQKMIFIAYDTATGLLKTGDAGNLTAYQSIDGASPPTILGDTSAAEISATLAPGAYVFDLADTETNGDMILYTCVSATGGIQLDPVLVFTVPSAFSVAGGAAGGVFIAGTNAPVTIAGAGATPAFHVTNSGGTAVQFESNGGNGGGFVVAGNGTGNGFYAASGAGSTAAGILAVSNATVAGGAGIYALGSGSAASPGILAAGNGAAGIHGLGGTNNPGILAIGQGTGDGLRCESGTGATGNGVNAIANSSNGNGLSATGKGSGDGMRGTGGATGDGIQGTGGASGNGIHATGVANPGIRCDSSGNNAGILSTGTGTGAGLALVSGTGNANGFESTGSGTGNGMLLLGGNGADGDGLHAQAGTGSLSYGIHCLGGGTSGSGLRAEAVAGNANGFELLGMGTGDGINAQGGAGASGDGIHAIGVGGVDFRGNIVGNVTGNLSGSVNSVATDVGITQGGADKAWGTATRTLTAATNISGGISDAVWDELVADHAGVGSTGAALAASSAGGDPWATPVPGGYLAGTAGYQIGNIPTATANADALLDRADAIETGLTLRQAHRLEAAAAAGKLSGAAGTTVVIRNAVADSKPRITATVSADGRIAVVTDVAT